MTEPSERSRVLTLVFTDLAESTALKSERGDVAVGQLIARHRKLVEQLAKECAGLIIDWAGDGCFLTFETSSAGVTFGLRLQQIHAEEPELPGVRVGIHLGEVTETDGPGGTVQVNGLAVDLASRIEGLARPGQVLMSSAVYQSARQRLGVDSFGAPILWQAHGSYALKGFDDPLEIGEAGLEGLSPLAAPEASEKAHPIVPIDVEVVPPDPPSAVMRVALIGLFFLAIIGVTLGTDYVAGTWFHRDAVPNSAETVVSIAVLPLDNLSGDSDQDYFAAGMTEAITAELAKIKSLRVISRTSAERYRDTALTLPEIATELNVENLIEGSVLKDGDVVRITIQLIEARTDSHLLSGQYDEPLNNVLKLQSDVALAIADSIRVELTPDERERIADAREVDPEAYDLYLQALDAMTDITPAGLFRVRQLFTKATELDTEFGEAWAGVAIANLLLGAYAVGPPGAFFEAANDAAARALTLDSTLGEADAVLALTGIYLRLDWSAAETRFSRAREHNPNSFFVAYLSSVHRMVRGDWSGAREYAGNVLELNPNAAFPISVAASVLMYTGREDQGRAILEGEVAKDPSNIQASLYLAWSMLTQGDYQEGIAEFERVRSQSIAGASSTVAGMVAFGKALAGQHEEARADVDRLIVQIAPQTLAIGPLPWTLFVLGDTDEAYEWLERGAETPAGLQLNMLRNLPFLDWQDEGAVFLQVADDDRYWRIIERLQFPPLPPEHPGYAREREWLVSKAAAANSRTSGVVVADLSIVD